MPSQIFSNIWLKRERFQPLAPTAPTPFFVVSASHFSTSYALEESYSPYSGLGKMAHYHLHQLLKNVFDLE